MSEIANGSPIDLHHYFPAASPRVLKKVFGIQPDKQ